MTATMACRGPDDAGTWLSGSIALGHRRLAVIDPSGGKQPMSLETASGSVAMVYSGEVYNFAALRAELDKRGHRFRTGSDTEVVLRGYLEWGERVVDRLNGMYAFAIWDQRDAKLVMVRDRIGIKPLYYYPTHDGVLFGSEPKAMLVNPLVRKVVDADGLRELFAHTKRPDWSLWQNMYEVEPGTIVRVTDEGVHARAYWKLDTTEHADSQDATIGCVRELITDIVGDQLVADVPRCVLLSGGLDSSAITGLAARRLADVGERVRTFSVDFLGQESNFAPDEFRGTPDSPFARNVVDFVGAQHRDIVLDPKDLIDPEVRRSVVKAYDMPASVGDTDTSLYLLFKAIREQSTVALSGEGADEVFGGYRWFHDPGVPAAQTFPWLIGQSAVISESAAFLRPDVRAGLDLTGYTADQYMTALAAVEHLPGESKREREMRTVSYLHLTRMIRKMLDRKDRISMAVGLEVRVPFCDHRLVEYVYNAPWSLKTFDGREKSLLRHATRHVVPRSVGDRVKSPYPSTQDPRYASAVQQQVKEILAAHDNPVFALIDRAWLTEAVQIDAATMPVAKRHCLDRILYLHAWFDIYKPTLMTP